MYFSKMKEKRQKAYRIQSYDEVLSNSIISMFTYKGLAEELMNRINQIEELLLYNGACAVWKLTKDIAGSIPTTYIDQYIVTEVDFVNDPDVYGMGADIIVNTENGIMHTFNDWRNNPDVVVMFNNSNYSPDMNVGRFSDALAELEVSLKLNVLFARMYPIPVCNDNKVKTAIEEALKGAFDGKLTTILSPDALSKYVEGSTSSGIDLVNITDVDKSQYIQYLAKYRDDLMRWFYSLYGMNSQGSSKMAQQTVDEVNQDSNSSMIIPHDMFKMRKLGVNEMIKKFGWIDAEVSFSECWMSRLANMDDEFKETDEELEENGNEETQTDTMEGTEEDTQGMDGENEAPEATEGADGTQEIGEEIKEEIKEVKEEIKEVKDEIKEEVNENEND